MPYRFSFNQKESLFIQKNIATSDMMPIQGCHLFLYSIFLNTFLKCLKFLFSQYSYLFKYGTWNLVSDDGVNITRLSQLLILTLSRIANLARTFSEFSYLFFIRDIVRYTCHSFGIFQCGLVKGPNMDTPTKFT